MKETAIDPSPTADATRFTLPARTSPTAKTPGRLVSNRYGARASGHCAARQIFRREIRSGLHEPVIVDEETPAEPRGARLAPAIVKTWRIGSVVTSPVGLCRRLTRSRRFVSLERDDLRARVEDDRRVVLDAADQIARHRLRRDPAPGRPHARGSRCLGEEDGRLAGRVSAADDDDLLAAAERRLDGRRAVVDAGALETRQVLDVELAVPRAGRDDDRPRGDLPVPLGPDPIGPRRRRRAAPRCARPASRRRTSPPA